MKQSTVKYLVTFNDKNYEIVAAKSPSQAIDIVNATKSQMRDIKCYMISPVMTEPEE